MLLLRSRETGDAVYDEDPGGLVRAAGGDRGTMLGRVEPRKEEVERGPWIGEEVREVEGRVGEVLVERVS